MVVEPVLCLHKQEEEATGVGAAQHQESTYLRDIQCQENVESYIGTLNALHDTIMETFPINDHINNLKQLILQWLELC